MISLRNAPKRSPTSWKKLNLLRLNQLFVFPHYLCIITMCYIIHVVGQESYALESHPRIRAGCLWDFTSERYGIERGWSVLSGPARVVPAPPSARGAVGWSVQMGSVLGGIGPLFIKRDTENNHFSLLRRTTGGVAKVGRNICGIVVEYLYRPSEFCIQN